MLRVKVVPVKTPVSEMLLALRFSMLPLLSVNVVPLIVPPETVNPFVVVKL